MLGFPSVRQCGAFHKQHVLQTLHETKLYHLNNPKALATVKHFNNLSELLVKHVCFMV